MTFDIELKYTLETSTLTVSRKVVRDTVVGALDAATSLVRQEFSILSQPTWTHIHVEGK